MFMYILCLNCNKKIETKNVNRKYCSVKCQMEYKQFKWEQDWLSGKINGNKNSKWVQISCRVKTYLMKKYNNCCSQCGWSMVNQYTGNIPLEVEHIDGNANNTTPENVTLLCPNCHSLTATYRGANHGRGRPKTWVPKS